ncbi:MAG: transcriptional repressor NrdR [Clostridia bacterium]|nr:transcriptional repressor NrdR [Clostridia bacterium]
MLCPFCGIENDKVIETRAADDGRSIRRRRECLSCGKRYTTYEKVEMPPVQITKRDGTKQPFNRDKIRSGLIKAFNKRDITEDQMERIVSDVEYMVYNKMYQDSKSGAGYEIYSDDIGKFIMQSIKKVDEVAYIRFVSVSRSFENIDQFLQELNELKRERDGQ